MIDRGIVIDHTIQNGELPHGYIQFHYNGTKEEAEKQRQLILTSLEQYPILKEKWDLYVKFSRDGFYSFDCDPEDGSIWGGCVKREKINQDYKLLSNKINECVNLKRETERLGNHNTRLVHEIVNLKAKIEKRIEELETGEDYGICSNPCIRELKKLLEKK